MNEAFRRFLMIRTATLLLLGLGLLFLAGCTADNVCHGLYEGFRVRNDLQSSPPERAGKPESPNYLEYERLRKEQSR